MTSFKTVLTLILLLAFAPLLLAQSNPAPFINDPLVPASALPGGAAFSLTVNGSGFVSGSTVNWNGSARATTFVSGSQLFASITTADLAKASTGKITVVSPAPGGGTSNVALFEVTASTTGPLFSGVMPDSGGNGTSADFNGDGNLDIVWFSGSLDSALVTYLGNGDGAFTFQSDTTIDNTGAFIVAADLNRDGIPDLAIANTNGTVSVLIGNGDGSFQGHIDYPTGASSTGVAVADLNGDGNPDLVVANDSPAGGVSVLLGEGNGFFQAGVIYPAGPTPWAVAIGDMNGDGKLDIVTAANAAVAVLLGNGDGTFQRNTIFEMNNSSQGESIVLADFDADGILDVGIGAADANFYELSGKGDGTLKQPRSYYTSLGCCAVSLVAGDFNGDGILDVALAEGSRSSAISLLTGKGGAMFNPRKITYAVSQTAWLSAGDFNNDGALDFGTGSSVLMQTVAKLSKTELKFGTVRVGKTSTPQTLTLTNYRNGPLNVSSIAVSTNFIQASTCGSSVPANGTCTLTVTFAPTQVGSLSGTLTITDDTFSPQTVALSGTGAAPSAPAVTLSPTSLTFGDQKIHTTSTPQNITVTNTGESTLTIDSIVASGDFAQTTTCGSSLRVNQSCTIIVTFTPTQTGTRTGAITVTDNAPDSPQTAPLTGTGTN